MVTWYMCHSTLSALKKNYGYAQRQWTSILKTHTHTYIQRNTIYRPELFMVTESKVVDTLAKKQDQVVKSLSQAFLKKLAMLPCPFLPAFLPFAELAGLAGAGLAFFGTGSSSEKDSQTASSLVTVTCQLIFWTTQSRLTQIAILVLDLLLLHHSSSAASPAIRHGERGLVFCWLCGISCGCSCRSSFSL